MAIPSNKIELKDAIAENFKKLKLELDSIPLELSTKKDLPGHAKNTIMSVNDLLAYLIGWGQLVLKWEKNKGLGLPVDFPETGYKWNELGLLAQKFYKDYEDFDFIFLKKELEKTVNKLLKLVESKTNKELYELSWYEKWTLGKMIQFNTSSPYKNAKDRIRKWKKLNNLK